MSTQYRLVQSGKTASGGCSAGPRFFRAVAPRIIIIIIIVVEHLSSNTCSNSLFRVSVTGQGKGRIDRNKDADFTYSENVMQ
jgi:hypothetical protein